MELRKFSMPVQPMANLIMAGYVFGTLPALAAGIGVAILERPTWRSVSRIGLIVGLVLAVLLALTQVPFLPNVDFTTALKNTGRLFVYPAAICFVPTINCWLLVRVSVDLIFTPGRPTGDR